MVAARFAWRFFRGFFWRCAFARGFRRSERRVLVFLSLSRGFTRLLGRRTVRGGRLFVRSGGGSGVRLSRVCLRVRCVPWGRDRQCRVALSGGLRGMGGGVFGALFRSGTALWMALGAFGCHDSAFIVNVGVCATRGGSRLTLVGGIEFRADRRECG